MAPRISYWDPPGISIRMSSIATAGALIVVVLVNVLAGMFPVTFTGDALLAIRLSSLLAGIVSYILLEQEVSAVG